MIDRSLTVAGPCARLWNSLPTTLTPSSHGTRWLLNDCWKLACLGLLKRRRI